VTLHLSLHKNLVVIQAGAYSDEGIGDMVIWLRPGESALGKSYQEWRAMGPGAIEWEPPPQVAKDAS
jgi:hypothetical protein